MPLTVSPLLRKADPEMLKVPSLLPPTKMAVSKTVPNPVAVPSKFTWLRTLPAGPGEVVVVIIFIENSPIALPDAIRSPVAKCVRCYAPVHCQSNDCITPKAGHQLKYGESLRRKMMNEDFALWADARTNARLLQMWSSSRCAIARRGG